MANSISKSLVASIKTLIQNAQNNAVRAINQERVFLYWNIGKHIVEEEQNGKERADYGKYLIKTLAKELTKDFGTGFSVRQLELCRQFYTNFPIANALRSQLNWTQYRLEEKSNVQILHISTSDRAVKFYQFEETASINSLQKIIYAL